MARKKSAFVFLYNKLALDINRFAINDKNHQAR
jgi:hypothetical protein